LKLLAAPYICSMNCKHSLARRIQPNNNNNNHGSQSASPSCISTSPHTPKFDHHAHLKHPLSHAAPYSSHTSCIFPLSPTTPIQLSTLLPLQSTSFLFTYLFFICCKWDKHKPSITSSILQLSPSSALINCYASPAPSSSYY
jgi:hypothetical protein